MIVVSERTAGRVVAMDDAIAAVEACFIAVESGEATVFPVVTGRGTSPRSSLVLKSGLLRTDDDVMLGVKLGTYWRDNVAAGLESHGSTVLLIDDTTGMPRALVGAEPARRHCAPRRPMRSRSSTSRSRMRTVSGSSAPGIRRGSSCKPSRAFGRSPASASGRATRARRGIRRIGARGGLLRRGGAVSLEETVATSRIVVAVTSANEPLVRAEWVRPGTHVSSMGSDVAGKQELDPQLVAANSLFADVGSAGADDRRVPARRAAPGSSMRSSASGTIGAVAAGRVPRRARPEEITVFDSSGMAAQDLAIARVALRNAARDGTAVCGA